MDCFNTEQLNTLHQLLPDNFKNSYFWDNCDSVPPKDYVECVFRFYQKLSPHREEWKGEPKLNEAVLSRWNKMKDIINRLNGILEGKSYDYFLDRAWELQKLWEYAYCWLPVRRYILYYTEVARILLEADWETTQRERQYERRYGILDYMNGRELSIDRTENIVRYMERMLANIEFMIRVEDDFSTIKASVEMLSDTICEMKASIYKYEKVQGDSDEDTDAEEEYDRKVEDYYEMREKEIHRENHKCDKSIGCECRDCIDYSDLLIQNHLRDSRSLKTIQYAKESFEENIKTFFGEETLKYINLKHIERNFH